MDIRIKFMTVFLLASAVGFIEGVHLIFVLIIGTRLCPFSNICFANFRLIYFYTGLPVLADGKLRNFALVV